MYEMLIHLGVTAGLLMVVGYLVDGIDVKGWKAALFGAAVLGLANAILRPVLVVLTFPLTILTLGLFLIVINSIMLMLAASFVSGFTVKNFRSALLGSVLLSILNLAVSVLFGI